MVVLEMGPVVWAAVLMVGPQVPVRAQMVLWALPNRRSILVVVAVVVVTVPSLAAVVKVRRPLDMQWVLLVAELVDRRPVVAAVPTARGGWAGPAELAELAEVRQQQQLMVLVVVERAE